MAIRSITFLFCVLVLGSSTVIAQKVEKGKAQPSMRRAIRSDGWEIPKVESASPASPEQREIAGVIAKIRRLTPAQPIVTYETFFSRPDGTLSIFVQRREVVGMHEYSVAGKKFAYELQYSPYLGEDVSVGAVILVLYFDNDGDGLFEERRESARLETIPTWVK